MGRLYGYSSGSGSSSSSSSSSSYSNSDYLTEMVRSLRQQVAERDRRIEHYEAIFADDCKTAARELAESGAKLIVQRGHVIVDRTMLVEHWWVKNPARGKVIDPSFHGVRGHQRPHDRAELMYVPIDAEGVDFDFEAPYSGCNVSWGPCGQTPACEWCTAREAILLRYPALKMAGIFIEPIPAAARRLLMVSET
jgi:hypothetical protein